MLGDKPVNTVWNARPLRLIKNQIETVDQSFIEKKN